MCEDGFLCSVIKFTSQANRPAVPDICTHRMRSNKHVCCMFWLSLIKSKLHVRPISERADTISVAYDLSAASYPNHTDSLPHTICRDGLR